ncbi:hypothetical protein ACLOJK_004851 [Asimina triloba]
MPSPPSIKIRQHRTTSARSSWLVIKRPVTPLFITIDLDATVAPVGIQLWADPPKIMKIRGMTEIRQSPNSVGTTAASIYGHNSNVAHPTAACGGPRNLIQQLED